MSTWFKQQRVEWVIEIVQIYGFINRSHIIRKFGISSAQAVNDIRSVQEMRPDLMAYNPRSKRYEAAE